MALALLGSSASSIRSESSASACSASFALGFVPGPFLGAFLSCAHKHGSVCLHLLLAHSTEAWQELSVEPCQSPAPSDHLQILDRREYIPYHSISAS